VNKKFEYSIGQYVTYKTDFKVEHGRIKSISGKDYVFVVYNCGKDWKHYYEYTAARTKKSDLVEGWI